MIKPPDYVDAPEALAVAITNRITSQARIEEGPYAKVAVVFYRGELELMVQRLLGGDATPAPDIANRSKAIAEIIVSVLTRHIPAYARQDAEKHLAKFLRETDMRFEVK